MRVLLARAGLLLPLVFLQASLHSQAPRVRDSAGVRIVENPSRLKAPVLFQLGATPLLHVGGIEGNPDEEFTHNQGYLRGVRLRGGFAVIDVTRLHYFDGQSKRVRIVGRRGRGPEEFLYLTSICRTRGDTLVVGDGHNRRLAILDSAGALVRTILQADLGSPVFDGCFEDGTFLLLRQQPLNRVTRLRTDGSVVNVVGEWPRQPYDMVTQVTLSFVATGQRLYFGNIDRRQVEIYDPTGKLLSIVRSDDPPTRITAAEVERWLASSIPTNTSEAERKSRLDKLRAMPHATIWPAFRDIKVDPAGGMWMQDYQNNYPAPDGWTAFDSEGRLLGRLVIPAPLPQQMPILIISFGINEVLVRRQDADGGAHLTVYPLVRTNRPAP